MQIQNYKSLKKPIAKRIQLNFYSILNQMRNDLIKNDFINKTAKIEDEKIISSLLLPLLDDKKNPYYCRLQSLKLIFRLCMTSKNMCQLISDFF
jgi:hypothetical protein